MRHAWVIGATALLLAINASAFEGTIKLRTTAASTDQLGEAGGGKTPDNAAILAMTPEQLAKGGKAQVKESMVYVAGAKVRMDMPLESKGSGYAVVDLDKGVTWFVIPSEKRYIEWSEADAKAIGEKMAQMKKAMNERMASLPPDQRKQLEAMMKNLQLPEDHAAPEPTIAIRPLNKQQTINGMHASGYQASEDDNTVVAWVTDEQPDLNKALLTVSERMEKLTPANMRKENVRRQLQQKGLPVMVQNLGGGRYRIEEIIAVEQKPVDAALFAVPQEFSKTTGRDALKNIPGPSGAAAGAPAAAPPAMPPAKH
ncbi:DUF4412 domain-containing protein [bacterium]|nr:DUF4412 domain-containing protein [bacterium]